MTIRHTKVCILWGKVDYIIIIIIIIIIFKSFNL